MKFKERSGLFEALQKPWLPQIGRPGVFQKPYAFRKLGALTPSSWKFFRPFKLRGMIASLAIITACPRGAYFAVPGWI